MRNLYIYSSVLCLFLFTNTTKAQFAGGSGTIADPWQINAIEQLDSVRNYLDSSFILTTDLDFAGSPFDSTNSIKGWEPIGKNYDTAFTGNFNGAGYSIRNLYINRPDENYIGLFGSVKSANIDSLAVIKYTLTGNWDIGSLVGWCDSSNISNCYTEGRVSGKGRTGGLVGFIYLPSTISECSTSGTVLGESVVGGLVGMIFSQSTISNCNSSVNVSGDGDLGGLIGYNYLNATLKSCYATGNISGTGFNVGGLVGKNRDTSSIYYCYATGNISGSQYIGGLVGLNINNATISNCYSTGFVSGSSFSIGGFVGENRINSTIVNCYSMGRVSGSFSPGGFAAQNDDNSVITNCYYNTQTSGQSVGIGFDKNSQSVAGLTTVQMRQQESFSGFNFDTIWAVRTDSTSPALDKLDNAPFAFPDTMFIGASISQEDLTGIVLSNDFDFETSKQSLLVSIDSFSAGRFENEIFCLPDTIKLNNKVNVFYRLGEIKVTDTLWGNTVSSVIVADSNTAPKFENTLQVLEDTKLKIHRNSFSNDNEGDVVQLNLINPTNNGIISVTEDSILYMPQKDYFGTDVFLMCVSDGLLHDTAWIVINVEPVNDAPVINSNAPLSAICNQLYTYQVIADDVDGDALNYSLNNAPTDMFLVGNVILWEPRSGTTTSGEITLIVTDGAFSTTETFTIAVAASSVIENMNTESISLYPNPVKSVLTVQSESIIESIQLISNSGIVVCNEDVNATEKQLDLNDIDPGIYTLQIKTKKEIVTYRICKL